MFLLNIWIGGNSSINTVVEQLKSSNTEKYVFIHCTILVTVFDYKCQRYSKNMRYRYNISKCQDHYALLFVLMNKICGFSSSLFYANMTLTLPKHCVIKRRTVVTNWDDTSQILKLDIDSLISEVLQRTTTLFCSNSIFQ
jgi:hypothetical protein